eukprot:TRINITY_DN5992_c1_g1_i1.p1 TRINITY_DN5992_c1_g1~~TRINITY_DN5992_c1_g1_i1.p1  ORF type:complete len:718 (+),score=205.54 TRINITY_DN5992_c1_g1_i1:124-2277(+)
MGLCMSKKGLQKEEKIEKISSPCPPPPPKLTSDSLPQQKEREIAPLPEKEEKPEAEAKKQAPVSNRKKVQESKKEEKREEPKRIETTPKEDFCNGLTAGAVRTSSCTKEELDAILIQCGRLSRSSSGKGSSENNGRGTSGSGSRKYAGSKRSYDFDHDSTTEKSYDDEEKPQIRPAHRRTPSREKDGGASELKRSGSRDEGRRSGSRRASRSPGRRQETPAEKTRPGKMVSVPATVSTAREAGNGTRKASATAVKRSGEVGARGTASPRARSPAKIKAASNENIHHHHPSPAKNKAASNENIHHHHPSQPSLSRNSSRKADQSPYRRNPLSEVDENIPKTEQQPTLKNQDLNKPNKGNSNKTARSKEGEEGMNKASHIQLQKPQENAAAPTPKPKERNIRTVEIPHERSSNSRRGIREQLMTCRSMEQQQETEIVEAAPDSAKGGLPKRSEVSAENPGTENLIPQTITRSRSSRRSRDLDLVVGLNPDTLLNNPSSYASLLLEDIQNYHCQNVAFSLPPCVSKACSILEAVADLNSSTSSNLSPAFSEEKISEPNRPNCYNNSISLNGRFNKKLMGKDPFVESEVVANEDDLMEPSLHKYVTVREPVRDMEQQESAGSNSFLGHHWSSSWEPNSAESTDRWTSSLSYTGEEVQQSEATGSFEAGAGRLKRGSCNNSSSSMLPTTLLSGKKRECDGGNGKQGLASFSLAPVATAAAGR